MNTRRYSIDLSEQMAACDGNYIRILKLLSCTGVENRREIMIPGNTFVERMVFVMEVVEKFKYTSTVSISQYKPDADSQYFEPPVMMVRMYHDASTAEVISYQNHRSFKAIYPVPNSRMYQPNEKEQLNLFLTEWLNLCLHRGISNSELLVNEQLALADT